MSAPHRVPMPIAALQPGPDRREVTRSRVDATIDISTPSEDLLPSDGGPPPSPARTPREVFAPAPHRALALASHRILRVLRDHPRDVGSWGEPTFAREVAAVRRQLSPVTSRRGLASSYGREAFRFRTDDRDGPGAVPRIHPVEVAYAIRWLELGDGIPRPGWFAFSVAPA
jgi:hypothetical protein